MESNWVGTIVFVAYGLFGMGLADVFWPVPTQRQCLSLARREAQRAMTRAIAVNDTARLTIVLMIRSELGE